MNQTVSQTAVLYSTFYIFLFKPQQIEKKLFNI